MNDQNERNSGNFWAGLLIGGLVGAGIAYFLSSEDKEEARKVIKEKAKDLFDNVVDFGEDVYKKGGKIEKKAEKYLKSKVEDAGEIVEDVRENVQSQVEQIPKVAQEAIENVQKVAQTAVVNIAKSAQDLEESHTVSKGIKKYFVKRGKKLGK